MSFARFRLLPLVFAALFVPTGRVGGSTSCEYVPAEVPPGLTCQAGDVLFATPALSAAARPALRVVTYNVHYGDDVAGLARAILTNPRIGDADVLLLQEIESYPTENRSAALAERLGLAFVYAPARTKRDGTHGLAILSRFPLRDVRVLALKQYELGWGNRRRIAMTATLDWNGQEVFVANAHLDTRLTQGQRQEQIQPVIDRARLHPRAIVAGDMNTISCWSALLPGIPIALPGLSQGPDFDSFMKGHGFLTPFSAIGGTGPLRQRLDAIFSRGLRVKDVGKERAVDVSDHLPLWADFGAL
jgi:endonuclease/exonuclease/phosphatase family metal-dependent hydrolase